MLFLEMNLSAPLTLFSSTSLCYLQFLFSNTFLYVDLLKCSVILWISAAWLSLGLPSNLGGYITFGFFFYILCTLADSFVQAPPSSIFSDPQIDDTLTRKRLSVLIDWLKCFVLHWKLYNKHGSFAVFSTPIQFRFSTRFSVYPVDLQIREC